MKNSKIRIAYVSKNFRINGITNVIMNYCLNLDLNKYNITIFTGKPICEDFMKKCINKGVNFKIIPSKKKNPLKYYICLFNNLTSKNFDIVHVHGNSATIAIELFIAKIRGIKKRIAHCHNTKCDSIFIHKMLKPFLNKTCTDRIACSKEAGNWLYGNKKFDVLNNCFDTKKFIYNEVSRIKLQNELNLKNKKVIGHVGIFTNQKNHEFMVKVMKEIVKFQEDIVLIFVGAGPNLDKIKLMVKEANLEKNIIFYGETTNVVELYDVFDLFLFPSLYEGLGIVLLEAQIKGLNCVISDTIPNNAIINPDKVVKLSLNDDMQKWASECIKFTSLEERKNYYNENINRIKKYDINDLVLKLNCLYSSNKTERKKI